MHTKHKLAAELTRIGLLEMAAAASVGYYDDFESPLDLPISQLVADLHARNHPAATLLATRVIEGEFDGTLEEATTWAATVDGVSAFNGLAGPKK